MEHITEQIKHLHDLVRTPQHYAVIFKTGVLDWRKKVGYMHVT